MNDDVNDAAWILVHAAQDMAPVGRPRVFTDAERDLLCAQARLFVYVVDRGTE